jgi:hypothetical protein
MSDDLSRLKSYSVWLSSNTRLALPTPIRLQAPDALIEAVSLPEAVGPFAAELLFRVDVSAASIKQALDRAAAASAHLADALTFVHATDVPDPEPVIAIGAEYGSGEREFAQFIRNLPLTALPRRFFKDQPFQAFYSKLGALPDGPFRDRIARALRLFRRSLSDPDPIDVFEDTWGALETVNHLIKNKYNLQTTFPGRPCKKCGEPTQVTGSSVGIKHALSLAGATGWKEANGLRNDISHAIESHDSIVQRIPVVLPELQRALTAAILDLLEITELSFADFIRLPMNPKVPAQAFFAATLRGWPAPAIIKAEHLPFVQVTVTERSRTGEFNSPGKKTVTFDLNYTPTNLTGIMADGYVEVLVTKDPEDTTATIVLSDFRIQKQSPIDDP